MLIHFTSLCVCVCYSTHNRGFAYHAAKCLIAIILVLQTENCSNHYYIRTQVTNEYIVKNVAQLLLNVTIKRAFEFTPHSARDFSIKCRLYIRIILSSPKHFLCWKIWKLVWLWNYNRISLVSVMFHINLPALFMFTLNVLHIL